MPPMKSTTDPSPDRERAVTVEQLRKAAARQRQLAKDWALDSAAEHQCTIAARALERWADELEKQKLAQEIPLYGADGD